MRFAKGEIYHIYNRGIEGREIFKNNLDYKRFLLGLKAFNSTKSIELRDYNPEVRTPGEKLVSVLSYILMPNHFHLLIRCVDEERMAKFLQKLFTGYTLYFNTKYKRSGVLFQGRSKAKHITDDAHINTIINYIHLNALDFDFPQWRNQGVDNIINARNALLKYQWSSIQEILGKKNNDIIDLTVMDNFVEDRQEFVKNILTRSSAEYIGNNDLFLE